MPWWSSDRGIATEANLLWLREHGYRYLVVSRERQRRFDPQRAVSIHNASGETLQLEKVLSEGWPGGAALLPQ